MTESPPLWKSPHVKRVMRSTLATETMASSEAVEAGDPMRAKIVRAIQGIEYHKHEGYQKAMVMAQVTDCESLYDIVNKSGTVPSERQLLLSSEAPRNDIEAGRMISKWVNSKQMLMERLTKEDQPAGDYLRFVLKSGRYDVTKNTITGHKTMTVRASARGHRQDYTR